MPDSSNREKAPLNDNGGSVGGNNRLNVHTQNQQSAYVLTGVGPLKSQSQGENLYALSSDSDVGERAHGVDADADPDPTPFGFAVNEDDSIVLTEKQLLDAVNPEHRNSDTWTIEGFAVDPNFGTVVNNGDGSWTVWPDHNFSGDMSLTFMINDGVDCSPENVPLTVVPLHCASDKSASHDTGTMVLEDRDDA